MNKDLIIVVYLDVGQVTPHKSEELIKRYATILRDGLDDSCLLWVIPRREGKTEIEIINKPVIVTDKEYKEELEQKINRIEKHLYDKIEDKEIK